MSSRPTTPRRKKTKTEVEKELETVQQEHQSQLELSGRHEEETKRRAHEVDAAIKDLSVDKILQDVAILGADLNRILSQLSSRMIDQFDRLRHLRTAVEHQAEELEQLHQRDIVATAIEQLLEEYSQKRTELEQEMAAAKASWEAERLQREREQKESDDLQRKQRIREKEEYEYQKAIERKKDQDDYLAVQRKTERENREKQEALEKSWQDRESRLVEQEEELLRLRKESAEFANRLKSVTDEVVAQTKTEADSHYRQAMELIKREADAEKRLAEQRIKVLDDTVQRLYKEIELLNQRLELAKQQVQDIALKAIESSSGAKALQHVNQIAIEQAKTRSGQA